MRKIKNINFNECNFQVYILCITRYFQSARNRNFKTYVNKIASFHSNEYSRHSLSRHPRDLTKMSRYPNAECLRIHYVFNVLIGMFNVCLWKIYVVVRTSVCVCVNVINS